MIERISGTSAISPSGDQLPEKKRNPDEQTDYQQDQPHERAHHDEEATRIAISIQGVPLEDLTPEARSALIKMLEDLDRLRGEVNWGRDRVRKLEKMVDAHSFLPVMNRRAFMRKLENMLDHAAQMSAQASLILIHMANADAIRRQRGTKAYHHFMDHVCRVLLSTLHPTDQIGSLGGNDFAILLMLGDDATAEQFCQTITESFNNQPCLWAGEDLPVAVLVGHAPITQGKSPETVMAEADSKLLEMG